MTKPVANLLELYERNPQRDQDIAWYADAKRQLAKRAIDHNLSLRKYAGVVAATSPMQTWVTKDGRFPNMDAADRVIAWHHGHRLSAGTLGQSARNAKAILNGARPEDVLGPKTRPFYLTLMGGDHVVLDRWALRAIDWPRESISEAEVTTASEPYETAAAILGISPSQLQAATWTQIRREAR